MQELCSLLLLFIGKPCYFNLSVGHGDQRGTTRKRKFFNLSTCWLRDGYIDNSGGGRRETHIAVYTAAFKKVKFKLDFKFYFIHPSIIYRRLSNAGVS